VTIGKIDVSADGVNGMGVERVGVSCLHFSSTLLALKKILHYLLANIEVRQQVEFRMCRTLVVILVNQQQVIFQLLV
jgi:hypothetical protein